LAGIIIPPFERGLKQSIMGGYVNSTNKLSPGHIKYRPDIDGLRGIAVLSVVGFHAFPFWITGGFIGVDIFFVISGFLISTIIYKNLDSHTFSFLEFYSRRIKRIFPALIVLMTACLWFGWFTLLADEYQLLGKHSAASAGFVSNFIFWQEAGYFDVASETKPLLHLWSLAIEEQFYIVWPLLVFFVYNRKFNLLFLCITICVTSFVLNVNMVHEDSTQSYYSPITRFWELSLGSVLAYVSFHKIGLIKSLKNIVTNSQEKSDGERKPGLEQTESFCHLQSFLGALLIGIAVLVINKYKAFPGWWALLPTLGAYLIISAGPRAWFNKIILSHSVLVWFGLISYPLYLYHWSILSFLEIIELRDPSRVIRIQAIVVSIVLAWLTYKFIEKPIRVGDYGARIKVVGLSTLMVIIGCFGYLMHTRDIESFSQVEEQSIALFSYDYFGGKTVEDFWGDNSCFLVTKNFSAFEERGCSNISFPDRPVVFLIGDSFAAYLAPGLRSYLNSQQINLMQFNSGWCDPLIVEEVGERCANINKYIVKKVSQIKPDILILFSNYQARLHGRDKRIFGGDKTYDVIVDNELSKIKQLGVKNIIVVGQTPTWKGSLPKVLARHFLGKSLPIPDRTYTGVEDRSLAWDKRMRSQNYGDGIVYVSLKDKFCDEKGCLTYIENDQDRDLIVFDYGHLTAIASDFVTQELLAPHLVFPSN
jgi:peptidoglycan/LPS O-acetylase OafA/YrhL